MAEIQREIASIAMDLKDLLHAAEVILDKAPDRYVYAATLSRKTTGRGQAGGLASQRGRSAVRNVVREHAFRGVRLGDAHRGRKLQRVRIVVGAQHRRTVAVPFVPAGFQLRLRRQSTVYVANDIPEPNDAGYLPALQKLLVDVHRAQRGSMLTLFTNRREMENCFEAVQPALKSDDLRLVCQKWGVSVKGLRDDFLADEHLSLFALKSFWEGFDAPGATLKGVVIPKLPFSKPTDPLSCERATRDDQAWRRYVLPAPFWRQKQAAAGSSARPTTRVCSS